MLLPYSEALQIYCAIMPLKNYITNHIIVSKNILNKALLKLILERKGYNILINEDTISIFKGFEDGELFYYNRNFNTDVFSYKFYNDKREITIPFDNNFLSSLLKFLIPNDKEIQSFKKVAPNDSNMLKEISFDTKFNCINKIYELYKIFQKEMDILDNLKDMTGINSYTQSIEIDEFEVYKNLFYIYKNSFDKDCDIFNLKKNWSLETGQGIIIGDYLERNGYAKRYSNPDVYVNTNNLSKLTKMIIVCFNYDNDRMLYTDSMNFSDNLNYNIRMSLYNDKGFKEEFYIPFFDYGFVNEVLIDIKECFGLPVDIFSEDKIESALNNIRTSTTNVWYSFVLLRKILLNYNEYKKSLKGDKRDKQIK